MFITLTRSGGSSTLRVAAAAIAHITPMADGSVLHLMSGEHLRVDELADDVERSTTAALKSDVPSSDAAEIETSRPACPMVEANFSILIDQLAAISFASVATTPTDDAPIDEETDQQALNLADNPGLQVIEKRVERISRRGRGRRA